jgi:hypothetical protein
MVLVECSRQRVSRVLSFSDLCTSALETKDTSQGCKILLTIKLLEALSGVIRFGGLTGEGRLQPLENGE